MDNLAVADATPQLVGVAPQNNGTTGQTNGAVQTGGGANTQSATNQATFIPQGVDVNTLPPVLRAELDRINKEMVRGFTTKTEEIANQRKEYEAAKQDAELFKQYKSTLQDERFVQQWNEYVKSQSQVAENEGNEVDPEIAELKQTVAAMVQENQATKAMTFIDAWASAKDENGTPLRPEFGDFEAIKVNEGNNLMNLCIELARNDISAKGGKMSPDLILDSGYKMAKDLHARIFEEGRKSAFGKVQAKIRNASQPPTVPTNQTVFSGDSKSIDGAKALAMAKKGIQIPRE